MHLADAILADVIGFHRKFWLIRRASSPCYWRGWATLGAALGATLGVASGAALGSGFGGGARLPVSSRVRLDSGISAAMCVGRAVGGAKN